MTELLGRILIRAGVANWIKFQQQGYTLRLCPGTSHRWRTPIGSRPVEEFFRRYVKPGDVVVDAGANVGIFTLVAAVAATATGKVYAIEPHPRTFGNLQQHLADNRASHVTAFNVALGQREGMVHFSDSFLNDDINHVDAQGIEVPVKRLDDLVSEACVALLKVDVEGYEKFVLDGAPKLLQATKCMLIEVEEEKCARFGYSPRELLDLILSHGFTILRISGNSASLVPKGFVPLQPEDLVAVRDVDYFITRTGYAMADIPLTTPSFRKPR